jgi:hypothetical protein
VKHNWKYPNCKQFLVLKSLNVSNISKMWQLHGCRQDVWEVLSHCVQLVLNCSFTAGWYHTIPSVHLPIFILDLGMHIWSIWLLQFAQCYMICKPVRTFNVKESSTNLPVDFCVTWISLFIGEVWSVQNKSARFPVSSKQNTPHTPTQSAVVMHYPQDGTTANPTVKWCSLCKYVRNHGTQQEHTVISKTLNNCLHSAATPIQLTGKEQSDIHSWKQHSQYAQCSLD